jgi:hypothetical protein
MAQIEEAMTDLRLTSLGRLNAVRQILANYKRLTGKEQLQRRRTSGHCSVISDQRGNWPLAADH